MSEKKKGKRVCEKKADEMRKGVNEDKMRKRSYVK